MNGKRTNPSKDINIAQHVWIGSKVTITKGAAVAKDSIIGTGSIVTKVFDQPNVVIAGIPAKIVKENVSWINERIPIELDAV